MKKEKVFATKLVKSDNLFFLKFLKVIHRVAVVSGIAFIILGILASDVPAKYVEFYDWSLPLREAYIDSSYAILLGVIMLIYGVFAIRNEKRFMKEVKYEIKNKKG
ncbi:MAG: hypothetical protein JKX74_02230 [Flavobacteriales bacterium]|nr:hypothetical protein [Flavobacteriales bacterium]PCH85805.1 MAG: hypothetical protein COB88_09465 [Flavobacteriales bacterium]